MPKALVIVESPAKAKTIERFLGDDYTVEASVGHIRDLIQPKDIKNDRRYDPELHAENKTLKNFGIHAIRESTKDSWTPWYIRSPKSQKTITQLRNALKKADALYLATDEDREGEAIAWHLVEVLKPDIPVYRMVFHEITQKAILAALENTREIDMNQVSAQETRRILDRVIGYDLSGLMRQVIGGGATGGRVQSPTLRRIVERERERISFVSAAYCSATADLISGKEETLTAKLIEINGCRVASGKNDFNQSGELKKGNETIAMNEEQATELKESLKNAFLTVESIETSPHRRQPKPPFTTSTFQQEVINKLGGSSSAAMAIAQSLYQKGYITYHRTDSPGLSEQAIAASRSSIENVCGLDYLPEQPRTYTSKDMSAQEAHEAIRPSGETFRRPEELKSELNKDQMAVYELIWKRTIASQMTDETGETVRVLLHREVRGHQSEIVRFSASGRTITHSGFRQIYADAIGESSDSGYEQEAELERILPNLTEGEEVRVNEIEVNSHSTNPPARFTEASLVKWMEEKRIGRPSTYAATIGKIRSREYVYKDGRSLVPTIKALVATKFLEYEFEDEVQYQYTADLNEKLDDIAEGITKPSQFLNSWYFKEGAWETKINDIQGQIKIDLPGTRQESAHLVGTDTGKDQKVFARFANQKPYVQYGTDGETASIPETLPPDQLTVTKAQEFLALAAEPDTILGWVPPEKAPELLHTQAPEKILGFDAVEGIPVFLRNGSFGPYVSLGEFPKWPPQTSKEGRLMKQPHHLKVIKVACAHLRAAENLNDDEAIQTILNEPKRGIGKRSIEIIEAIAEKEGISFYEALSQQTILKEKSAKAIKKLIRNLGKWQSENVNEPTGFRLRDLMIDTGYWKEVSQMEKSEEKIKILENLLATMNEFLTVGEILETLVERQELKNAPKPKTASLLDNMPPDGISIDDAINLLSLPRSIPIEETITVTLDPAPKKGDLSYELIKGEVITVHNGPFGPYIRIEGSDSGVQTRSITEGDIFTLDLGGCLDFLSTPKKFARQQSKKIILKETDGNPSLDNVSGKPIEVKTGKFGPYVTDGVTNASLQLGDSIEEMTAERAKELLSERRVQE